MTFALFSIAGGREIYWKRVNHEPLYAEKRNLPRCFYFPRPRCDRLISLWQSRKRHDTYGLELIRFLYFSIPPQLFFYFALSCKRGRRLFKRKTWLTEENLLENLHENLEELQICLFVIS